MCLLRRPRVWLSLSIRYHSNYYTYLGVRYNAPVSEITAAIDTRKERIEEIMGSHGITENQIDLKRALAMLKRMRKILLNDELRKDYNFQERESLADTIPELEPEVKRLGTGDGMDSFGEDIRLVSPHAEDFALLRELEKDRSIHVYNNSKEVVTHTNYTYEELVAMSEIAMEDDYEKEAKIAERKRFALFILPLLLAWYYYFIPAEKCPFRRKRLTWVDKQMIMKNAESLVQHRKGEIFIPPTYVEPEHFLLLEEGSLDVESLKNRLFTETMERRLNEVKFSLLPAHTIPNEMGNDQLVKDS